MSKIAIIGGGIAGLSLAYYLKKAGKEVILFESSPNVGGVIRTKNIGDYLIEEGPNSTLSKEVLNSLISELGIGYQLLVPNDFAKNRFVATSSTKLTKVPTGFVEALTTTLLSFPSKLRALGDLFIFSKTGTEDISVSEFIGKHFGKDVANNLVAPMLNGIWAADIDKLSARSALPMLWNLDQKHSSIIRGGFQKAFKKGKSKKKQKSKLITFKSGLRFLTEKLAEEIGGEFIKTSHQVRGIELQDNKVNLEVTNLENQSIETLLVDRVISTIPSLPTASLIESLDKNLSEEIKKIPYAPLGVLHLAYDRKTVKHELDGFGFLVQPKHNLALLGAIFSSSLFEGRAPKDKVLLTCFIGGAKNPEFSDVRTEKIKAQVISELNALIGATENPEVINEIFWERAIPNYALNHHRLEKLIIDFETKHPQIKILGNWRSGISLNQRIEEAYNLSQIL